MHDRDVRAARFYARLRARRLARRYAWRAAAGDPQRFAEIMRDNVATGYAYYYDEPPSPTREIGRQLVRDLARVGWCCLVVAVGLVVSDWLPIC